MTYGDSLVHHGTNDSGAHRARGEGLMVTDGLAVVLDRTGRVVGHNRQWLETAARDGLDPMTVGVGIDYLTVCDRATGRDAEFARRAGAGIRAVLAGTAAQYSLDYPCHGPDQRRWFTLRVAPLAGPDSGVLVSHVDVTAIREAEQEIRSENHALWALVDSESDFALLLDSLGRLRDQTFDTTSIPAVNEGPIGMDASELVHPADRARCAELFARCVAVPGHREEIEIRAFCSADGEWRHVHLALVNMLDDPEVAGVVVAGRDRTEQLRSDLTELLSSDLRDKLPVWAVATDADGIVLSVNRGAAEMLGLGAEAILGRRLGDFVSVPGAPEGIGARLDAGEVWVGETDVRRADGSIVTVALQAQSVRHPLSGVAGRSYLAIDVTEERALREALFHHDRRDALTGLANRQKFLDHLRDLTAGLAENETGAVALVSLDGFREINARHGTDLGDQVLRAIGEALQQCVGPTHMVARLYGDVFAVAADREITALGEDIQRALAHLEPVHGVAVHATASVGLRLLQSAESVDLVVDDAVAAMADVKGSGGNGCRAYDDEFRTTAEECRALREDLWGAVARGEMTVEYQPVVRLDDGSVVGAEALVRWDHPTRGRIGPDRFIPLAERTSVIHELGSFVVDHVCREAARWRDLRPETPMSVALNLSAAQLVDRGLPDQISAAVRRYHLDPGTITLELTESMLMGDAESAQRRLAELKAVGVRLAIDDFGSGYSSLSRLKQLPVDVVKIDRCFVTAAGRNPEDGAIVKTIVSLAEAFAADVIAEGIETDDDARAVADAGCSLGQGYLWSPAVPAHEIDALLDHRFQSAFEPGGSVGSPERPGGYPDALRTIQHELATPLAVLNAAMSLTDEDGNIRDDMHGPIRRGVLRLSRLVESLDLVDRLDRGTLTLTPSEQDVGELAREAVREVGTHLGRQIDVLAPDSALALVDAPLIGQVLVNLLTNAVKYSPDDTPVVVGVEASASGPVKIEVRDLGPGIPPEMAGTMWRKFGRLDHSKPGSGIGLYLARGIARAHGGELRYRSGDPCGSVFVLELPTGVQG